LITDSDTGKMDFRDKKVLITGASRGIGKAAAVAFAAAGAQVGINYRTDDDAAREVLSGLKGGEHTLFKYDIADAVQARELVEDFVGRYDRIDILVNNAGIAGNHPIDEVDYETWRDSWKQILDTNLIAVANLCYCTARSMIKNGGGRIINVSSRGAFRGEPLEPAYGASKAGLNSLSQSLAKALGKYKIYVGVVAPGFTETDMGMEEIFEEERKRLMEETPLARMAKPEEVAHAILYLASEGAEYATGAIIDINGASYLRS
jgi:NAD(P)-dependent dehydrogenase (short-subunit alcohol dehydrogenase family)